MSSRTTDGPVLVLSHPTYGWTLRPARLRERLQAYLRADTLDRLLGQGVPAEADPVLFLHARRLALPRTRRQLARSLRRVMDSPDHPTRHGSGARAAHERVRAARGLMEQLAGLLDGTRPLQTQGVALTRVLLADGCGPLYRASAPHELEDALRRVIDVLIAS